MKNKNSVSNYSFKRTDRVLLIYTGGTIGMGCNRESGALEPLDFNHLISCLPEFAAIETGIDSYQFTPPIDSSDMTPRFWSQLVRIIADRYDDYDGFVILHGTDTMAFTASALSFMLENLTKPVVLTGSQLPIGQPRTDGEENLATSIEVASAHHDDGTPIVPEVCIYFNGHLLRGNRATKANADGFNAFESYNYPHLADAGVNITYHEEHILKRDFTKKLIPQRHRVHALPWCAGADHAPRNRVAGASRHGDEDLRQRKRATPPLAHATAQGGYKPRNHCGEHQPV